MSGEGCGGGRGFEEMPPGDGAHDQVIHPLRRKWIYNRAMQTREWVTATASRDTAPRVGLIPSFYAGGEEMNGKKIRGLVKPVPLDAAITGAQLEDMLRLAVELGGGRRGGLATAIGREDWVVLKVSVPVCEGVS